MYSIKFLSRRELPYETPSATPLEFMSEGLLCTSPFDENNRTELFERLEIEEL